jgi:hypothetical protein
MTCGQFPANRLNEPKTQSDIASRPLPKSPASSSQYDVVPQMIVRSSNVRPRKFAIGDAKRLLQQYLPIRDSCTAAIYSITSSARSSNDCGMAIPNVLAVFMLMISSTFVICSTGSSAGFSPLRMRPALKPIRRYASKILVP